MEGYKFVILPCVNCNVVYFRIFEKAVAACGKDFRSDKLWDTYITWEENLIYKTNLYDRVLQIPTQLYSHHFEK